jgi:hypothetical protein
MCLPKATALKPPKTLAPAAREAFCFSSNSYLRTTGNLANAARLVMSAGLMPFKASANAGAFF